MSDLPYVNNDGVIAGWRSGGSARHELLDLLAEEEQTPRLIAEVIDLLGVEQRVRDASDRAVAEALSRSWSPSRVPALLRLAESGRDGITRPGSPIGSERVVPLIDTSASQPDGVAGWYPALPGWDDARYDLRDDEDAEDDGVPSRVGLLEVDPVLRLWDGRAWTGHVLTEPVVEVRASGFAIAMARSQLLAAGRQALLLRFLVGLGPDATPADLVAAALLRGWIERHAGGWTPERSVVPDAVTAPPEARARRRAVDVLRRRPAGWYEVLPPLDPALCDAQHAYRVLNDHEAVAAVRAGYATCLVREWDGTAWVAPAVPGERTALPADHAWTGWSVRPLEAPVRPAAAVAAGAGVTAVAAPAPVASPGLPSLPSLPWRVTRGEGAAGGSRVRLRPGELLRIDRTDPDGVERLRFSVHRRGDALELRRDGTVATVLAEGVADGPAGAAAAAPRWLAALADAGALDVRAGRLTDIDVAPALAAHLDPGAVLDAVRLVGPEPLREDRGRWEGAVPPEDPDGDLWEDLFGDGVVPGGLAGTFGEDGPLCDRPLRLDGDRVVWVSDRSRDGDDRRTPAERAVPIRLAIDWDAAEPLGDRLLAAFRMDPYDFFDGDAAHLVATTPTSVATVRRYDAFGEVDVQAWRIDPDATTAAVAEWLVGAITAPLDGFVADAHLTELLLAGTIGHRFTLVSEPDPDGIRAEYGVWVALTGLDEHGDGAGDGAGEADEVSRRRKRRRKRRDDELDEFVDAEEARGWSDEPLEWDVVGDGFRIRLR